VLNFIFAGAKLVDCGFVWRSSY